MKKLVFWLNCTRAYSLPMSIMAWLIPFSYGYFHHGNVIHGLIALIGIICAHLGANLFDDIIDYKNYVKKQGTEESINLKKGKCRYFLENKLTVKTALKVCGALFSISVFTGMFFVHIYHLPIVIIMAITGVLCLLYPKSGYFGLSEVIIGTIFSPLLFTGVYYVMTASFSIQLLWLSLSFAIVAVTLLYTDFFLDFNSDKVEGKRTLPTLLKSKKNAYFLYMFMIFLIYANIFTGIHSGIFSIKYAVVFLSLFFAFKTIGNLQFYLEKEIKDEKEFLNAMNTAQKFIAVFTLLCVVSFYLEN